MKFVLEYSIGELRAQLDPKSAELADMRGKVEVSGGGRRVRSFLVLHAGEEAMLGKEQLHS